jgi:sugar lactone lactonase YvrE
MINLLWVDIYENKIIESDHNNSQEKHYLVSEGVTNILLQDNENYLMSSYDSLFSLHSSISKKDLITKIPLVNSDNRINDADVDLNGQVWISTMDTQQKFETGKIICHDTAPYNQFVTTIPISFLMDQFLIMKEM